MKKYIWLSVILLGILNSCNSVKRTLNREYTVLSYNVENLFDTVNDPKIPDEEFLPESEKKWDEKVYQKKQSDLVKVISEANANELPEIVGLIEVENLDVLKDLVNTGPLKDRYNIIHEESPDYRGIDVALIYRRDAFKEISHEVLPVVFPEEPNFKTRDILYVTGKVRRKTIHVFVNHWPSRIGGDEKTEPKRVQAANVLRSKIDQILAADSKARIIVMGDMNDEPVNKSLKETLKAGTPDSDSELVNLMFPDDLTGLGTYFYSGSWNMLDNLVVSKSVIDGKSMKVENRKGNIFKKDWMIYTNKNGDQTPNRTYVGNKYVGGVSDHFPVYFKLKVR